MISTTVHRIQAHNDLSSSGALEQMGQISLQENPFLTRKSTQTLFLCKEQLRFFHCLEIVKGWLVPSMAEDPPLLRTGK
jgi:hypothetical protein